MKSLKVSMDMVNCGLLLVVLILVVIYCKKTAHFTLRPASNTQKMTDNLRDTETKSNYDICKEELNNSKVKLIKCHTDFTNYKVRHGGTTKMQREPKSGLPK
jgi:hypothetical protein